MLGWTSSSRSMKPVSRRRARVRGRGRVRPRPRRPLPAGHGWRGRRDATAASATPNHIDSRQPSTSASRAASSTLGADGAEVAGGGERRADALLDAVGQLRRQVDVGRRGHARPVAGADQRTEQGDADGAAELADGVVERRRDALLLVRQRLGDRRRRRAHAQADAERPGRAGRAGPTSSHRRPTPSVASSARPSAEQADAGHAARCACRCAGRSSARPPTAASSRPPSAAARRRRRAPSSRARPAGTGSAPGRCRTSRRTR